MHTVPATCHKEEALNILKAQYGPKFFKLNTSRFSQVSTTQLYHDVSLDELFKLRKRVVCGL